MGQTPEQKLESPLARHHKGPGLIVGFDGQTEICESEISHLASNSAEESEEHPTEVEGDKNIGYTYLLDNFGGRFCEKMDNHNYEVSVSQFLSISDNSCLRS